MYARLGAVKRFSPSHRAVLALHAQIFVWCIEKYGTVNGDQIFYRKVQSLLEVKWGSDCLPDHGTMLGSERCWADILKNRFVNGRRTNATVSATCLLISAARRPSTGRLVRTQTIYTHVPINRVNLCDEGAQIIDQGLHVHMQDDGPATPQTAATEEDEEADGTAPPTVSYKTFNPTMDARRIFRNVYIGDPVLDMVIEVEDRKAWIKRGQYLLFPTDWFEYLDSMAMPVYVVGQIDKAVRADKPSYKVKMVGDGIPVINVDYYLEKHPRAYEGMEDRYLLNPAVKCLSGAPPTE